MCKSFSKTLKITCCIYRC